jgi:hypothetical protein
MKTHRKFIWLFALLFTLTANRNVSAREQAVIHNGDPDSSPPHWSNTFNAEIEVYSSDYSIFGDGLLLYDIFGAGTKDLLPGDKAFVTMELRNESSETAVLYMKARPVDEAQTNLIIEHVPRFNDYEAYDQLLDAVELELKHNGEVIYSGSMRGSGSGLYGSDGILLGPVYAPGEARTITAEVTLPEWVDFTYANTMAAARWQWYCDEPVNVTQTITPALTLSPEPTVTNTPTVSPEPAVTNTPTDSPKPADTNTPTVSPTPSLSPIPTRSPGRPSVPTAAPPAISATPSVTATVSATPGVTLTITPTVDVSVSPGETPSPAAEASVSPAPTATPDGGETDKLDVSVVVKTPDKLPQTGGPQLYVVPILGFLIFFIVLFIATYIKRDKDRNKGGGQ